MLALAQDIAQRRPQLPDGDREWRGVYARRDAGAIPPGYLADARNARCRKGVPGTRAGVVKPAWANRTLATMDNTIRPYGTVYGRGVFKDPDSLEWTLIATGEGVYRAREGNASESVALPMGVKIVAATNLVQAFNKVYLFRGRDFPPLVLEDFDTGFVDLLPQWDEATDYTPAQGEVPGEEVAYGPFFDVAGMTLEGAMVIAETSDPHNLVTGQDVVVRGADQSEYNARWNITVVDDTHFSFLFPSGSGTTPTGTITASRMNWYYRALGSVLSGVGITRSSSTATVTSAAHGFTDGQSVTVTGAAQTEYNITATISNVTTDTFDYTVTGTPATPATGTINVRNNDTVLAGQSPDTNPEGWERVYDILPSADTALYTQNRLLVPTAYNPDTGEYDAKVDYVIATDYLDELHFDFVDQFRINQGDDDTLIDLAKFNDQGTVICFKSKSVWVLANIAFDLASVSLSNVIPDYGLAAPRAFAVVGSDVYFVASGRGVVSITQTVQNKLQGVDLPLSDPIDPWMQRIVWRLKEKIRVAWWDSKLYVSVPFDDARQTGPNIIEAGAVYGEFGYRVVSTAPGQTYFFTADPAGGQGINIGGTWYTGGVVTAVSQATTIAGIEGAEIGALLQPIYMDACNAILVYDFLQQAWQGRDSGSAIVPQEFFEATAHGRYRLFFIGADGWVNLVDELDTGDHTADVNAPSGISARSIDTLLLTRGYTQGTAEFKRGRKMAVVIGTWQPSYSVTLRYGGVAHTAKIVTARTKSRTRYYQPWNAAAYDTTNVNADHATAHREDYSIVPDPDDGVYLDEGVTLDLLQETREVFRLTSNRSSRYVQVEIRNTTGRLELRGSELEAQFTERRKGVLN